MQLIVVSIDKRDYNYKGLQLGSLLIGYRTRSIGEVERQSRQGVRLKRDQTKLE